jgi:hypothetical protein
MVTRVERLEKQMVVKVLSPPCGMVTNSAYWFFHTSTVRVLSPPCGMVTAGDPFSVVSRTIGSKPTVWDGDSFSITIFIAIPPCSEPTVWDGDKITYSYPVPASQKGFLMCRVELKDLHLRVLPSVPNAPCGVERLTRCFFL